MHVTTQNPTLPAQPDATPLDFAALRPPRRGLISLVFGAIWTAVAIAAVMLATLAVVIAIASHLSRPGQYTVFGHPFLTVMSGSMSPKIRTGDLVYDDRIGPVAAQHLHVGEIVTFRTSPGSYETITHRIHAVLRTDGGVTYQTKGDDNPTSDYAPVNPGQVVGLYRGDIRYGGYVLNALHHPLSLALLVASPFLWILSGWFFELARESDRGDGKRSVAKGRKEGHM